MKVSKKLPLIYISRIISSLHHIASYTEDCSDAQTFSEALGKLRIRYESSQGFISIFRSSEARVKYNDVNGVSFVITTGLIRSILDKYMKQSTLETRSTVDVFVLLDVLRYFKEVDVNVLEFQLGTTNRLLDAKTKGACINYPLCDRYQEHSWNNTLKMSYPSYDTSTGSLQSVVQAEYNTL